VRIDAHHHFWKYDPGEFGWINDQMKMIRRDFLPADLQRATNAARIDGVVSVQARQTLEETKWLLQMAAENEFIRGVVGWLPLVSKQVTDELEFLGSNPKLKGVRQVLQGEPDERYLRNHDFNAGVRGLKQFDLIYDLLIFEHQLPATIEFVDRHPAQPFVLDHLAKPRIKDGHFEPWNKNIRELARRENVSCKLSGMVTEADWSTWTEEQLKPYFETVLESLGSNRLMFGSDWPVCLVAGSYQRWTETCESLAAKLSASERGQLFGGTAARIYCLE
jgi:L-fuconolactonase